MNDVIPPESDKPTSRSFSQISESDIANMVASLQPPRPVEKPFDDDVEERIRQTELQIHNQTMVLPNLVDSAIAAFKEQRYYDIGRLFLVANHLYDDLFNRINNSDAPGRIKRGLVDFSLIAFPRAVDIDSPVQHIQVMILTNDAVSDLDTIIEIKYFNGKTLKFKTSYPY